MRIQTSGAYANLALSAALKKSQLSDRDKAFVTLLVHGVTRNLNALDGIIKKYSKKPIDKLPDVLLNTLRLSIFQIENLPDTPPSAVLNTAAEIARACGHKGMASYTTAVLRNYLRDKESGVAPGHGASGDGAPDDGEEPSSNQAEAKAMDPAALALRYSIPEWLVRRWLQNFGQDEARTLLQFSTSEPRLIIRVNEQAITTEGLITILEGGGVKLRRSPLVPSCLVLASRGDPSKLPGYSEGLFSIQDDAAALAAIVVAPKPAETVLDLCAAPGGKALFLAEMMENRGRVIAVDKSASRLELLKRNRNRLGITNVEVVAADGRTFSQSQLVDRILIDAPCSGTGVLNRKSDLRYKLQEEDIISLSAIQAELLNNASTLLKPGGTLVYATCSVEPEENSLVVDSFLQSHPDFLLDDLSPFLPKDFIEEHHLSDSLKSGKLQILPSIGGLSGFFVARMNKTGLIE